MLEAARGLLTESHEQIVRVNHYNPSTGDTAVLEVEEGSLTFDEGRAPFASLQVTTRIPDVQTDLDAIDPRTGSELGVYAGYRVAGDEVSEPMVWVPLVSRGAGRPADTMRLTAGGAELLMDDWSSLALAPKVITSGALAGATLAGIITWFDPSAQVDVDPGLEFTFLDPGDEPIVLDATSDVLGALLDIADRTGLWVYEAGLGRWKVRRRPSEAGVSAVVLNVGENGTVIDTDSTLARTAGSKERSWANTVIVVHEWTTTAGEQRRTVGWASVTSGPMSVTNVGVKAVTYTRTTPASTGAASLSAAALLRRHATRGRTVSLRAIAAWWLRPGDTATVKLPQGPQQRLLVSRVEFGLTDGTMRVDLRHPETFDITTGE